ncbi:MAG: TolC family protein [Chitinophagaceae bacterium]
MRKYLVALLLVTGLISHGQQPPINQQYSATLLTLEEAINKALADNYGIQLAKNDSALNALEFTYRNANYLPRVNGNTGLVLNNNDQYQKFNDGAVRERKGILSNNLSSSVALNWTLFNGLKLVATREKAVSLQQLGSLELRNNVINTIAQVINTYYGVVQQKQQLIAIGEQLQINEERVKLADYKLTIGVGTKTDLLQSKVDLNAQKAAQLEQVIAIKSLKEQLNSLLNYPAGYSFEVTDTIPFEIKIPLSNINENWVSNNPSLLIARKNIQLASLTVKERKADRWPSLQFNANYNFNRLDNKAVVNPFQPLFSRNQGFNYGFSTSIPLFNNFTVRKSIAQANLALKSQELLYSNQKMQLNWALIQAYNEYEAQQKALQLEEENIVLAKENVTIVLEVYRLNSTTLIQLKEAQKSLQDAYTRLIRARYRTKTAETELLRIKGELLK